MTVIFLKAYLKATLLGIGYLIVKYCIGYWNGVRPNSMLFNKVGTKNN
jgi:hypothetical protein